MLLFTVKRLRVRARYVALRRDVTEHRNDKTGKQPFRKKNRVPAAFLTEVRRTITI
jgi:hypothetical protein